MTNWNYPFLTIREMHLVGAREYYWKAFLYACLGRYGWSANALGKSLQKLGKLA